MKRSEIVSALANIASQGKYTVDPQGARAMNNVFAAVAGLINELEAEEAADEAAADAPKEEANDKS